MEATITTDQSLMDDQAIHDYLSNHSYWAKGIPFDTLKRAMDNSICFGLLLGVRTIGFTRVATDRATFAYLCDVYVLPEYQGMGYGKKMVSQAMKHQELQGLRRWCLLTADAHSIYADMGWRQIASPERWMELHNPNAYLSDSPAP